MVGCFGGGRGWCLEGGLGLGGGGGICEGLGVSGRECFERVVLGVVVSGVGCGDGFLVGWGVLLVGWQALVLVVGR